jgi:glycerol-3-phosphate cytidylyltransferase-like family protein
VLGALFIAVCVLLYVVINNSSRTKKIENSLLVDEYEKKERLESTFRYIDSCVMDIRREIESMINEYTQNYNNLYDLISKKELENNHYIENRFNNLDSYTTNRFDEITRLIDSRVDKLDSKLEKTTNKTYFDFNNLLNESILKEVNTVKEKFDKIVE